ncbi:MAG: DUF1015 domain-containing protein [Saccharofermentans sp.]|nr:DUF1015 domain-containing protein [Saccharofermentans sp.]
MKIFNKIGCIAPDMLFPAKGTDLKKWAVIACDQYTSEPDYWQAVSAEVGNAPSTLNLILPEVYLGTDKEESLLSSISESLTKYRSDGTLVNLPEGFMLTDRATSLHPSRKGLVLAIDLETYSFEPGNKNLCRATEGTVLSRIPPRIRIRENSPIELPHIMLLIDDPEDTVIGGAFETCKQEGITPFYDTDLMQGSGHIEGTFIEEGTKAFNGIVSSLEALLDKSSDGLLFLVGDGNHSLATAKAHWENVRKNLSGDDLANHPARYALAEVVNIHDKGLDFEPIHRVVFGIGADDFISGAVKFFEANGVTVTDEPDASCQVITVTGSGADRYINLKNPPHSLAVGSVQMYIDSITEGSDITCDYIHGEDSVRSMDGGNNTGILLPAISKDTFFATVINEGVFPRKTFSMGEAFEKRFYMEVRGIEYGI